MKGDLDLIVMKAPEKDGNRRYDTAKAFAGDVCIISRMNLSMPARRAPGTD
ncbi:MAG: hypothetical protein QM703_07680 [Gemmatales bacterium]